MTDADSFKSFLKKLGYNPKELHYVNVHYLKKALAGTQERDALHIITENFGTIQQAQQLRERAEKGRAQGVLNPQQIKNAREKRLLQFKLAQYKSKRQELESSWNLYKNKLPDSVGQAVDEQGRLAGHLEEEMLISQQACLLAAYTSQLKQLEPSLLEFSTCLEEELIVTRRRMANGHVHPLTTGHTHPLTAGSELHSWYDDSNSNSNVSLPAATATAAAAAAFSASCTASAISRSDKVAKSVLS
mmetsp:Transcript_6557/g.12791  ORF Transcript_6557/g.12791 Transcript_6557/m.12791 type:complete len:245 (-) Transcript_6557:252-986(-)